MIGGRARSAVRRRAARPRCPRLAVLVVAVCGVGLSTASRAADGKRCFDLLEAGASAQRAGDIGEAEQRFREALAIDACRAPTVGPLLYFSLGNLLVARAHAAPHLGCEAQRHLEVAADADNPDVAQAAGEALATASARCLKSQVAEEQKRQPEGDAQTPALQIVDAPTPLPAAPPQRAAEPSTVDDLRDEPPAAQAEAPDVAAGPSGWSFGPRVEGGVSGLWGDESTERVSPGVTAGLGLVVQRRTPGASLALLLEPGVTMTTLRFSHRYADEALGTQSGTWVRTIVEATLAGAWFPGVGDLAVRFGVRGGWVADASERSDAGGGTGWVDVDMASLAVDGVLGASHDWALGTARLRVTVDGATGLARINALGDLDYLDHFQGWFGYRFGLSVSALF